MIIGVNRTGVDGNEINYTESSSIFDIDGFSVKKEFIYKNLSLYKLDINKVLKNRNKFPSLDDQVIKVLDLKN